MKKKESEFQKILRLTSQFHPDIRAVQMLHKSMYQNLCRYLEIPRRTVLTNMYMPGEIFYAMDLIPLVTEYIMGTMATMKRTMELLAISERRLRTTGFCSYITGILGVFETKQIPFPEFLIVPSEICEDTPHVFEYLKYRYQGRYFFLDIPFSSDADTVDYVARQLEDMVAFIESHIGRSLDRERLVQAFERSNRAREYGMKIKALRSASPPLMNGRYGINLAAVITLFGTNQAVDILKNLADELEKRSLLPHSDTGRIRLYWIHLFPSYAAKLIRYLERDLNAAIVGEEIFVVPSEKLDINDPYRSLARKILNHPVHGTIQNRIAHIVNSALTHHADGVINFSPTYCRVARGVVPFLKKEFKTHGVPFLELTGDPIDFRNYSKAQMETRLEAFMEIVKNNAHSPPIRHQEAPKCRYPGHPAG